MARAVRIKYEPNKAERYPCSKRGVKELFRDFDTLDVYFERKSIFHLERPGTSSADSIVAELFFTSADNEEWSGQEFGGARGEPTLWMYTVAKARYDDKAVKDFRETVCPALNEWLRKRLSEAAPEESPDSQVSVAWDGVGHKFDYGKV